MQTTFETVDTQWFDENAIRLPNYKVGRVNYGNGRSYVRLMPDGILEDPFRLYTSLTTAISTCSPMERGLLEWYCKLGLQEADRYTKMKAHYGTLMHRLIGDYLINNFIDLDDLEGKVQSYLSETSYYDQDSANWAYDLQYDLAAFVAFSQDFNIKPLGIEYVLLSDRGFGTLIDLVCEMDYEEKGFFGDVYKSGVNAGQPKETKRTRRITGLMNFKSGRHPFWRSNGIQVECERLLWQENFPDLPINACFNWSPKEWRTDPGYNLKDWTGEIEEREIDSILELARIRFGDKAVNKKYIMLGGTAIRTKPISENITMKTAKEYCLQKYTNTPK